MSVFYSSSDYDSNIQVEEEYTNNDRPENVRPNEPNTSAPTEAPNANTDDTASGVYGSDSVGGFDGSVTDRELREFRNYRDFRKCHQIPFRAFLLRLSAEIIRNCCVWIRQMSKAALVATNPNDIIMKFLLQSDIYIHIHILMSLTKKSFALFFQVNFFIFICLINLIRRMKWVTGHIIEYIFTF